jgi:hypothetical protein
MRSSIIGFIGIFCLVGSSSLSAVGQQQPPPATAQSGPKEIKFKVEWITTGQRNPPLPAETDSISLVAMDGDNAMTANKIVSSDIYRKVTLHPEVQKDGSTLVDVSVSEFTKESEREWPRLTTRIRLKGNDVRTIQTRTSKGEGYQFDYQILISMDQ